MAIFLPGPPINFPPPPPPPGGGNNIFIGEPKTTYSAMQKKEPKFQPVCKLLVLINPLDKDVEFEFIALRSILIGKAIYKAGRKVKYKVKKREIKYVPFWTEKAFNYKMLDVGDNAGKKDVYWSLSTCTFP